MHLNVLVWHEIGACLRLSFNRTSNGVYSRMYNHFFPLSTVVEPDDYQGSQPVSLWNADIVTLILMSRKDPGGGGDKCVCEKVCKFGSTLGNNLQYVSWV